MIEGANDNHRTMRKQRPKPNGAAEKRESPSALKIVLRRRQVAELLSQSYNETEIARELGISVSSVSRDISALRAESQQFVDELADSQLAFHYKRCIDGLNSVKREAWQFYRSKKDSMKPGERLAYLKLIKECDETLYSMIQAGPANMALKAVEEKMDALERSASTKEQIHSTEREVAVA